MKKKTLKKSYKIRLSSSKRTRGWSHVFIFRFTTLSVLAVAIIAITAGFLFNFLPQNDVLGARDLAMVVGDGSGGSDSTPKTCEPRNFGNPFCKKGYYYVYHQDSKCNKFPVKTGNACPTPTPTPAPKVTVRWAYFYCSGIQPHLRFSWGTNYTSKTNFYMGLMNDTNIKKPSLLYRFKVTDTLDDTTTPPYYYADIPLNPSKFRAKVAVGDPILIVITDGLSNVGTKTAQYTASGLKYPTCPAVSE